MQGRTGTPFSKTGPVQTKTRTRTLPFVELEVEEGKAEWKNIPEAVRTAILALSRGLAESDRELESLRAEFNPHQIRQGLKQEFDSKANTADIKQTFDSIAEAVEDRVPRSEFEAALSNYVQEDVVVRALEDTISKEDVHKLLERKVDQDELKLQLNQIHHRLDKITSELTALSGRAVSVTDLAALRDKVEKKVDIEIFKDSIRSKANIDDVQAALKDKVDTEDLETLLSYKADGTDIEKLSQIVEGKADQEAVNELWEANSTKANARDLELVTVSLNRKVDTRTVDQQNQSLEKLQREVEEIVRSIEGVFEENRLVIDKVRSETDILTKDLQKKASKQDIAEIRTALAKKVEGGLFVEELGKLKEDVSKDTRICKAELEKYRRTQDEVRLVLDKAHDSERNEIKQAVQLLREQLDEMLSQKAQEYEKLFKYINNLHEVTKGDSKVNYETIVSELKDFKKHLDQLEKKKLNHEEARGAFGRLESVLNTKASIDEVQSSLNAIQAGFTGKILEVKEEYMNSLKSLSSSVSEQLSKKASAVQVNKQLSGKIDSEGLEELIENSFKSLQLDGIASRVGQLEQRLEASQSRSHEAFLKAVQIDMEDLKKAVAIKANLEDVSRVLDQKCNIDDINKTVKTIRTSLESKCSLSELEMYTREQSLINEFLCTENIVARWRWSSGTLVNKTLVPWESQSTNTLSDNFIWSKNDTAVTIVTAGIYQVSLGMFSRKKPTCQVFLNGEPVLSMVNSSSYVVHHSAGKLKDVKTVAPSPSGITLLEYLLLPHRARISVSYVNDLPGEGFLCIRRVC